MGINRTREKVRDGFLGDLPQDIQSKVMNIHKIIKKAVDDLLEDDNYSDLKESRWAMTCIDDFCVMPKDKSDIGSIRVYKNGKNYKCMIQVTGHFRNHQYGWIEELLHDFLGNVYMTVRPKIRKQYDMTIVNEGKNGEWFEGFDIFLNPKSVKVIWDSLDDRKTKTIIEEVENDYQDFTDQPVIESAKTPEYNVDMTESEARKTLRTLSQTIINDTNNKKDYKVSQYTANIYANIITKNLLPIWTKGYHKFSITLDSYQSFHTLEFKTPPMTQDFVSRFINGRESLNGFLHRSPDIKIKMSPRIFHTMKNPDDAFRFFKAAIKYYDSGLEKAGVKLMTEAMRMNHELKHLVASTKLSGIVTYPMKLLFVFDDVNMSNVDTFKLSSGDINSVNKFIRGIYTNYAAPEKEKKKIVEDVKEMVKALRESADNDTTKDLILFPEAVEKYLFEGFTKEIKEADNKWISEQVDLEWNYKQKNSNVKYLQEKFGVKKLKKIPTDLVAYIQIETESIKDSNDKMMISSYCLGKIEIVEWYIELLEVGSKKYIVPHTKPYLEAVRTQLLACFKKIMNTPIPKKDRPLIDIQYPKGYEG